jgi:hypothetical protein
MDDIMRDVMEMVKAKNEMYGASYDRTRDEFGSQILIIRLMDKINRLKSFMSCPEPSFDSYEDTVRDIIGYCILELKYIEKEGVI